MTKPLTVAEAAQALGMSEARVRALRLRTGALVESGGMESMLDRVLVKRLRPLVSDAAAARASYEQQVVLRTQADARAELAEARAAEAEARGGQAEARAEAAEQAAAQLRLQVADLEVQVAALAQRPTGWLRRRRVTPERA